MDNNIKQQSELLENFNYPEDFLKIYNLGLTDLEPWSIMTGDYLRTRYKVIKDRYKDLSLVPFARRLDNDDIACWDLNQNKVVVFHDYAEPDFQRRRYYVSFWDWFRDAIEDLINW